MPHLANLMIPTAENDWQHPLSALAFSTAIALRIAGKITDTQARDYLNNVIVSNGGQPLSSAAIAELAQIRNNFEAKNTNARQNYLAVLQFVSLYLENAEYNGVTAADFDSWIEI